MNQWLAYNKERRGADYIETEQGFITFLISGDECFIEDLFIRPDCRLKGHATELVTAAKERGIKQGSKVLTGTIKLDTYGATDALKFHLKYGAHLVSAHNNVIVMAKEI